MKGLAQGYAGAENEFGGKDKVIGEDGLFIINPQFEWTGGGIYSTTEDLAKWGKLLYEGKIIDTSLLLSSAVPAKLGRDTKYALGVIIRPTSLGIAYGHSGFFPGYMTELLYFPEYQISVAIQCNSSDFKNLKISLLKCLIEMAKEGKGIVSFIGDIVFFEAANPFRVSMRVFCNNYFCKLSFQPLGLRSKLLLLK